MSGVAAEQKKAQARQKKISHAPNSVEAIRKIACYSAAGDSIANRLMNT
jgi:hypothetical protein